MKYHFNTFGRDKNYKGCLRRFEFDTLDEAVKAADKLAKTRIQIVVLDEATMPIYRTGKWYVKNGLKGEFYKRAKMKKLQMPKKRQMQALKAAAFVFCGKDGERIFKQIYQNTTTNKGELNAQQKSELKNELETLLKCL